jgi:protocatechuate 3,4-dioxygenase beta subunit
MIKPIKAKFSQPLLLMICFALFCCLSACGGSKDEAAPTPDTTTVASIGLSSLSTTVKSDGSTTSTITITALNASNAALSDVTVTLATDAGVLSAPSVVTNSTTPATVTFSCGSNKANRTATVMGTSGSVSAQIPIQIIGSSITVTTGTSSISAPPSATSATLTITVKDAGNNPISNAAVTLTQSPTGGLGTGSVTLGATSGTTNGSGVFTTTATGVAQGSVTITAAWLGTMGTTPLTVTATGAAFGIENQYRDGSGTPIAGNPDPTAVSINSTALPGPYSPHSLKILVNAPGVTTVRFATTIGGWNSSTNKVLDVAVGSTGDGADKVSAILTSTNIGFANVQVSDIATPTISDTLTVTITSGEAPYKVLLQAAPTVVPISVGTTTYSSSLTATVSDASNHPLVGQPVAFSIVDGTSTSGGETISKVLAPTNSSGQAVSSFISGFMPSPGTGVQIRASVVGTSVETEPIGVNLTDSGNDAGILIGGVAGSIAFGQDSKAAQDSTGANYLYKMSVLVADSNGNPVAGAVVNLGVWPIAWSDGVACTPTQFYYNEDDNENMILDGGEDGYRKQYPGGVIDPGGHPNGLITPVNSAGGTVPASVTTDANGVAGFIVTYPKSSGMWIYDRIRATTIVLGTETRAEIILYLKIVVGEETICAESPFKF